MGMAAKVVKKALTVPSSQPDSECVDEAVNGRFTTEQIQPLVRPLFVYPVVICQYLSVCFKNYTISYFFGWSKTVSFSSNIKGLFPEKKEVGEGNVGRYIEGQSLWICVGNAVYKFCLYVGLDGYIWLIWDALFWKNEENVFRWLTKKETTRCNTEVVSKDGALKRTSWKAFVQVSRRVVHG